jgi:acetoin utilization protein AcuB
MEQNRTRSTTATAADVMRTGRALLVVGLETTFEAAARQMRERDVRHAAVVAANGRLAGIVTDAGVLRHGAWDGGDRWVPTRPDDDGASIAPAVRPAETAPPETDVVELVRRLIASDDDAIVIIDEGLAPIGMFTEQGALAFVAERISPALTVADRMATELVTATPDQGLDEAWAALEDNEIHHLPIREGSRLVGVASARDFLRIAGSVTAGGTVAQLLLRRDEVQATTPATSLRDAARRMAELTIGCLPVLDRRGDLVGLVTATDAIKAALATL